MNLSVVHVCPTYPTWGICPFTFVPHIYGKVTHVCIGSFPIYTPMHIENSDLSRAQFIRVFPLTYMDVYYLSVYLYHLSLDDVEEIVPRHLKLRVLE